MSGEVGSLQPLIRKAAKFSSYIVVSADLPSLTIFP